MFKPIITPSHTAVIFAPGSANKIGATIGTTTTAISIKSKKNPSTKITAITITNCVQNPPGNEFKNSRTNSSPPNARNAAVSIAAPSRITKTKAVVFAVSIITPCKVLLILSTRIALQMIPPSMTRAPITPIQMPCISSALSAALIFIS